MGQLYAEYEDNLDRSWQCCEAGQRVGNKKGVMTIRADVWSSGASVSVISKGFISRDLGIQSRFVSQECAKF